MATPLANIAYSKIFMLEILQYIERSVRQTNESYKA